jgi:hypothetical protein
MGGPVHRAGWVWAEKLRKLSVRAQARRISRRWAPGSDDGGPWQLREGEAPAALAVGVAAAPGRVRHHGSYYQASHPAFCCFLLLHRRDLSSPTPWGNHSILSQSGFLF